MGLHGLRVWLILAVGFRVLCLNLAGFRVLRCVRVAGFANCCARVSGISFKTSYFSSFPSHSPCGLLRSKTSFRMLRRMHRNSVTRKMLKILKSSDENLRFSLSFAVSSFGFSYCRVFGLFQILARVCGFWYPQSPLLTMPLKFPSTI